MALTDLMANALETLWPPTDSAPEKQYQWRVRVALVACGAFMIGCTQFAYDHGYVPGHEGFARASQLQQLAVDQAKADTANAEATDRLRAEYDADVILTFDLARCHSTIQAVRDAYDARIQARMRDYQQATGSAYILEGCGKL